jgi:hypothetical protein
VLGYRTIALAATLCTALLSACGGGGGSAGTTPTGNTIAFPLQAGYKALVSNGFSIDFAVSGDCSGTARQVNQPAAAASAPFEGVSAVAAVSTQTFDVSNCTPAHTEATETEYFDADPNAFYASLGSTIAGSEYGVYQPAASFPVSVRVGDAPGTYGTELLYSDSSKVALTGRAVRTWRIDADTASTAFVTLTTQVLGPTSLVETTQQSRYRIAADGVLSILSVDIQVAGANPLHLTLTPTK